MRSLILALVLMTAGAWAAAPDVNMKENAFVLHSVAATSTITVDLPDNGTTTVVHLNVQSDGSTASAASDRLIVQHDIDADSNDLTNGNKILIVPGAVVVVPNSDVKGTTTGERHRITIRNLGANSVKIQFIRSRN